MTTEALKSASLTNLDATPPVPNSTGEGANGYLKHIGDYVTASGSMSVGSTYQLVRIPSNAKVKKVTIESPGLGAGKVNLGLSYSTSKKDGTQVQLQGAVINASFFGSDIDLASAVRSDVTNESGSYTVDLRNQPIWKAAGLSADPGGFFDLVATVNTTAITTGGKIAAEVEYVE